MHSRLCLISILVLHLLGNLQEIYPQSRGGRGHFRREIDSIVHSFAADSLLAPASIGIEIADAPARSVLYALNAEKAFQPASTAKILTTGTALHLLGSRYKFITPFSTNGTVSRGQLSGDLIVQGSGDPLLVTDDLDSAAAAIAAAGIRHITGNLVGNISLFDSTGWGKGWMWDDEPEADEAFISPLTVNKNSITISIVTGDRYGTPPVITSSPVISSIRIENNAIVGSDEQIPPIAIDRPHGENTFIVRGRIGPRESTKDITVSVAHPDSVFLQLLRDRLIAQGISVGGTLTFCASSGTRTLFRLFHTLDTVVWHINKWSYNLGAENLLRVMAAADRGGTGIADTGLALIGHELHEAGADTAAIFLADGSGVSRYSLISADAMVKFLVARYHDRKTFPVFQASLPLAGQNGTLAHRMKGTAAVGNAAAKTGTMTGISSLAGYVKSADGRELAYCIFVNNVPRSTVAARSLQDAIVVYLAARSFER